MRMRKKKNSASRLAKCEKYLVSAPASPFEDAGAVMSMDGATVYLEIGAGKGGFACEMAKRYSDVAYFAMERVTDCVVLAAEKADSEEYGSLDNLRFMIETADNLMRIFKTGSIDKIFLNFSDPWPKKGYAKRRLTHRRYLAVYMNLLRDGGELRFKTDNVGLFDFSLEEIEAMGLECSFVTRDLHASPEGTDNVMTEYEKNFSEQGMKINMLSVKKPAGFAARISPEFTEEKRFER